MLLGAIKSAYARELAEKELLRPAHASHNSVVPSGAAMDDVSALVSQLRKMQVHCNFLTDLDSIGDMNDPKKLREVIQNEAYILAILAEKNETTTLELKKAYNQNDQLRVENKRIQTEMEARLTETKAKFLDIDFDLY